MSLPDFNRGKPGPKPGYKQSPEHILKRMRVGSSHHSWLGNDATPKAGRSRALRSYKDIGPCNVCGSSNAERHHLDECTTNNAPENIVALCRSCHMSLDGRLEAFRRLARQNSPKARETRWANRQDTLYRSGDPCPDCDKRLQVVQTTKRGGYRFKYIGCRKSRGGCGFSGGSLKELG